MGRPNLFDVRPGHYSKGRLVDVEGTRPNPAVSYSDSNRTTMEYSLSCTIVTRLPETVNEVSDNPTPDGLWKH